MAGYWMYDRERDGRKAREPADFGVGIGIHLYKNQLSEKRKKAEDD